MGIIRGFLFTRLMLSLLFAGALVLLVPVRSMAQECQPVQKCGDVDGSGKVGTVDALKVLKAAVGVQQSLVCTCSAGDGSCEADLQTCNSDLVDCGDDLAACEGTPPAEVYEPIVVCGTDEPGDKFTLDGVEYTIVETDVRLDGTNRVYALRFPVVGLGLGEVRVRHYRLLPSCYPPDWCSLNGAVLNVCGKNGVAQKATYAEYSAHVETGTTTIKTYKPAPLRWTSEPARKCYRSVPCRGGSEESLHLSSRPRRCESSARADGASA